MHIDRRLLALAGVVVISFACKADPASAARKHLDRAAGFVRDKQYESAIVEYRSAIAQTPNDGDARAKLARVYRSVGDIRNAFQEVLKAADLLPDRADLQLDAGQFLLAAGRFDDAKQRARTVLEKDRNNVRAVILMGNALVGLKSLDEAADLDNRAIEIDPGREGTYRNLGVLELVRGHADAAEAAFKHALEIDPKSVSAHLALVNLYRATGARADAERACQTALAIDANNVSLNQAMAALYIEWDRAADAEPFLIKAADHSPDVDATLALADYYIGTNRLDRGKAVLAKPLSTKDGYGPASIRMAVIEYLTGNEARGHQILDDAIKKDPRNAAALGMKARLLLSDKKMDEALALATSASSVNPHAVEPYIVMGRVYAAKQSLEDARRSFNDALKADSRNIDAQLALARLHLQRGEIPTALGYAEQGVKTHPSSLDAQLLVVQALAAHDELKAADATVNDVIRKFPSAPQAYTVKGNIAFAMKDAAGARKAWEQALTLAPENVDALGGLATLLAVAGKTGEARSFIDARIKDHPANLGLLLLGAKIRIANRDAAGVEDLLKRALKVDPANLEAYTLLGQTYIAQHRVEEAKHQFTEVIKEVPKSMEAHTMMGLLAESQKDQSGAIAWYDKALQLNPRSAVAANNLAWIYYTQGTKLDAAVTLAETATKEMPNQPEFQDTLGCVYYKAQRNDQAVTALQLASRLAPANATFRFHLGMAYVQAGSDSQARRELQEALRLNPRMPEAAEAKNAIASLVF